MPRSIASLLLRPFCFCVLLGVLKVWGALEEQQAGLADGHFADLLNLTPQVETTIQVQPPSSTSTNSGPGPAHTAAATSPSSHQEGLEIHSFEDWDVGDIAGQDVCPACPSQQLLHSLFQVETCWVCKASDAQQVAEGELPKTEDKHRRNITNLPTIEDYSKAVEERIKQDINVSHPAPTVVIPSAGPAPTIETGQQQAKGDTRTKKIDLAKASDGASIVAANKGCKKAEKTIDNDVDSFMRTDCAKDKWLIIELSQFGRVDSVAITSKEMYSCRVKQLEVFGRTKHPQGDGLEDLSMGFSAPKWTLMGNFTAENKRGTLSFKLPQPAWVKFVALHVLSYYGSDPMFALNSINLWGATMAQDLEEALATPTPELEGEPIIADVPAADARLPPIPLLPPIVIPAPSTRPTPSAPAVNATQDPASEVPAPAPTDTTGSVPATATTVPEPPHPPQGMQPAAEPQRLHEQAAQPTDTPIASTPVQPKAAQGAAPADSSTGPQGPATPPAAAAQEPAAAHAEEASRADASTAPSTLQPPPAHAPAKEGEAPVTLGAHPVPSANQATTVPTPAAPPSPSPTPTAPTPPPPSPTPPAVPVQPPVHVPPPAPTPAVPTIKEPLPDMDSGKPQKGGNVYETIKQEIVSLRRNQELSVGYVRELHKAINQRTAELGEDTSRHEGQITALQEQLLAALAKQNGTVVAQVAAQLRKEMVPLLSALEESHAALRRAEAREALLLTYAALVLGLAVLALTSRGGIAAAGPAGAAATVTVGTTGNRFLRRLLLLLLLANGAVALLLNVKQLQAVLPLSWRGVSSLMVDALHKRTVQLWPGSAKR